MIDQDLFRSVLGRFASGVTVVTANGPNGDCGITVSAFCSLSLDPPLVLACVDHAARMHPVLERSTHFAVNVLDASQEPLARRFSDPDAERFDGVGFRRGVTGTPLLTDALAVIECRKADTLAGGDHSIFIGEVAAADTREGEPLLYYRGGYARLAR